MTEKRIQCPPTLTQESGRELRAAVSEQLLGADDRLVVDFAATTDMDGRGAAWLVAISDHVRKRGAELTWENADGDVASFLDIIQPSLATPPKPPGAGVGWLEAFGGTVLMVADEALEIIDLVIDSIYWSCVAPFEGKGLRWDGIFDEMQEMGVRAIRIVCLMNFLLGLIIAMLSSAQIASFGLSIYVADLIIIGFARELAAIMTSVVVSARTGAAIAAEISTMKVQEEIDALRGMGLSPTQFLVVPKLVALVIVLPCLTTLGLISGLLGGMVWGVFVLEFEPTVWWRETISAAEYADYHQGLLKSLFFAMAIALIGCHNGFRVTGGSRGVGLMTTRAVVMDIFTIIVIDIIFATIFYYWL